MSTRSFGGAGTLLVVAVLLGAAGCTSIGRPTPPSRFYLLAPLEPPAASTGGPALGVGPVRLAEYLDRPQIVTRRGRFLLDLGDFDRWGEPLDESIARVLAANLAALLHSDRVQRQPGREAGRVELQLALDVVRFDGPAEGPVELVASWRLRRAGDTVLRTTRIEQPLEGSGYEALVAAMSRALHGLSTEIAGAVASD